MTREAKVGMLTGLGVIVLIGVLLSNYLDPQTKLPGGGTLGGTGTNAEANATGTMAPLPVGPAYRKEVISPAEGGGGVVAVPAMGDSTQFAMATGRSEPVGLVAGVDTNAAGRAPAGPVVQDAVAPIELGQVMPERTGPEGGPPVVMVAAETRVGGTMPAGAGMATVSTQVTYVIASGDTLSKIAKKFYHDAAAANVQKIVAANPGMLKDERSTLVQGRKLMIPVVTASPVRASQPMTGGVVPLPGDGSTAANVPHGAAPQTAASGKKTATYTVQQGDTLAKIARKFSPANATTMEKKLVTLNGIKDPDSLSAGMKLKVPA